MSVADTPKNVHKDKVKDKGKDLVKDPAKGTGKAADRVTLKPAHHAITAVWRQESAKVIAHIARIVRDVGVAQNLAQDALEHWPVDGVPHNPGAWP